jgi:hypothetical protein
MPKLTSTEHSWTAEFDREDTDNWPDLQISKTLLLCPARVTVRFRYDQDARVWRYDSLTVHGTSYRPLKAGGRSNHGPRATTYRGGRAPEEYHPLIEDEQRRASIEYRR